MSSATTNPLRLHFIADSPVAGLAVAERRVVNSEACIIFVHGALDRGGSFARLARRLENFDAVAYDRRGYQGSRDLKPADLDEHVDDLAALIAREVDNQPVILFGHSFGGVVTFGAALRDPASIRLVVNYESPLQWLVRRPSSHATASDDTMPVAERFFRRVVSDKAWDRLSEGQRESRRLDGPALLRDLAIAYRHEAPYDLSLLRVPATYVHGDGVFVDYYRSVSAQLTLLNPSITTVEIERAKHDAHLQNADQLAAVVQQQWARACSSA
jgi:pimeloyl-ACP methyl ester carboxylesterase